MARNIKKIAHDLGPLSEASAELSSIIFQMLDEIKLHAKFDDEKMFNHLTECEEASKNLVISTGLIEKYVSELNKEADKEGIFKDL
jgi:hypothetical protein